MSLYIYIYEIEPSHDRLPLKGDAIAYIRIYTSNSILSHPRQFKFIIPIQNDKLFSIKNEAFT